MITLDAVSKTYDDGRVRAVDAVSLEVAEGEFVVLLGESGSGKTTTLKMINRLIEPTGGVISLHGTPIARMDPHRLRRTMGYAIQGVGLFPHMRVAANVAVVPRLLGWNQADIAARVDEVLELVGLPAGEYRDRFPAQLSGGQQQRVGFARALAAKPEVMLMDEPFGALDPITRGELQREFQAIQRRLGLTVIMVTHDILEALLLADRIGVMWQGSLAALGTPHAVLAEANHPYVEALMASVRGQVDRLEHLAGNTD